VAALREEIGRLTTARSPGPRGRPSAPPPQPPLNDDPPCCALRGDDNSCVEFAEDWSSLPRSWTRSLSRFATHTASESADARSPTMAMIRDALPAKRTSTSSLSLKRDGSRWRSVFVLESVMGVVITANCVLLGVSADLRPGWFGWVVIDACFALMFLSETVFKIRFEGCRAYMHGEERFGHLFELGLVAMALLEIVLALASWRNDLGIARSLFKVVRGFRVCRVVRVLRFDMFTELKIMVRGTLGGLRTLMWSAVLIVLPVYMLTLILRETLGGIGESGSGAEYFDSIPRAFFCVFRCIVVGECSDGTGRPIFLLVSETYGWWYAVMYCTMAVFMSFGLFNVIIATFVERVMKVAENKSRSERRRRLRDKGYFASRMVRLLRIVDDLHAHRTGAERAPAGAPHLMRCLMDRDTWIELTPEMFEELRQKSEVQHIFDELDLADEDQYNLFKTLDSDLSGTVDLEEFCQGISKLRGEACRSDIIHLDFLMQEMRAELRASVLALVRRLSKQAGQNAEMCNSPGIHIE